MKVLVYGPDTVAGWIVPWKKEIGIEIITISEEIVGDNLDRLLENSSDIGLAIIDTNGEYTDLRVIFGVNWNLPESMLKKRHQIEGFEKK